MVEFFRRLVFGFASVITLERPEGRTKDMVMKTIHVNAAVNKERRKSERNRADKVIFHAALIISFLALTGCQTGERSRTIDAAGMYANPASETLAIGNVRVVATPKGEESAVIRYGEDNAWLSPSMKLHELEIFMTGSNSVSQASKIVDSIQSAFVAVHPKAEEGAAEK